MVWDYAEANPMHDSSGNWMAAVDWTWKAVGTMPASTNGKHGGWDDEARIYTAFRQRCRKDTAEYRHQESPVCQFQVAGRNAQHPRAG